MFPGSSSSEGFRGLLKRFTRGRQRAVPPEAQASTSHTHPTQSPAPPEPSPEAPKLQLTFTHERRSQPPAQTQQSLFSPQSTLSAGQQTSIASTMLADHAQSSNTSSRPVHVTRTIGEDGWTGLKVALGLVERSSDVFPPLKSAVSGFLGVVHIFEAGVKTAAHNREEYAKLASDLQAMIREFAEHPGEQTSSRMLEALNNMASGLEKEIAHVRERQQHSGVIGFLDSGDVQKCHERVETLRHALQDKAMLTLWRIGEEQQVDIHLERLNAVVQAMHDSSMSTVIGRRKCTFGTREAILAGMREWANNPAGPKVYWLNGMAGTGKTTLAYSFCAEMQLARRLGASFFCSRVDADSQDVTRIVPTIAYQLARLLPQYREVLVRLIGEDKDIGARNTETQFEKLIRDPLLETKVSVPEGVVVTIDALDECDRRDGAQDILDVLFLHAKALPIKFLVTCRPEPGLFDALQSKDECYRSVLHLHDIEASFVQADIRTFLEVELDSLAVPQDKLNRLAEQAGTFFIYAATVVRYIHPKGCPVNSHQRLEDLLSLASEADTSKHDPINDLYTSVLVSPFNDRVLNSREKKNIRLILDTVVCAKEPMSVTTMTKILGLDDQQDLIYALQHLRSVLHVSHGANLISTFHASFSDFMFNRERSGDLCCNITMHNQYLALRCFGIMRSLLRFNICKLESSFVLDENVSDLAERLNKAILPELFYACRYWGDHLLFVETPDDILSALRGFLAYQLLFWMEVLNLRNCIGAGAQTLTEVHAWLQKSGGTSDMLELALDAGKFATVFGMSPASRSTPHIYISALPFWPETRPVRQQYWKRTRGLIRLEGAALERRDLSCVAAWNTAGYVYCVAFSPDGTRIVSSSAKHTIHIWDTRSGRPVVGSFQGHTDRISSVCFSPNGTRIVSGSHDTTVRVWDARSGALVSGPLMGHTNSVSSVGFSSDGTRIVSGSHDKTIRVWDAYSGALVAGPFKGHTSYVKSVAFSPNGTCVVSGSWDRTIRIWDACSGALMAGPLEGHTHSVTSVGFSPDGTCVVSGSHDKTIRVWNICSGALVAGPFKGHTDWVNSVGFSCDGAYIVSGSHDKTVRVWDVRSQLLVAGPLEGHTDWVNSVGFSSDGTRVVSGSDDKTVRVWDARSGPLMAGSFDSHTDSVTSVGFSPDGARIVSSSSDLTIRVWGTRSGALVAGPFKGHTSYVMSVGFSPDGTRIVSGSYDTTVRVWDVRSSALVAGPFKGHTGSIRSVRFSPDGTRVVSGSDDGTIRVWDARSGLPAAGPFIGHTGSVRSVGFSPRGTRIVSGSSDTTVRMWDVRSGALVAGPFNGHTGRVNSVAFSPGGTRVVSSSSDHTIRVWDARSGLLMAGPFEGHTRSVGPVGFSPDSHNIVSGSDDKTIRIWNSRSGDLVAGPFEGHTSYVNSVGFSPDGTLIVSGSHDTTIRVWDPTPFQANDPGGLKDWLMDENGVITTRQGCLLLCIPADLWTQLMRPHNTVCIYHKGAFRLDFQGLLLGSNWVGCYQCR